MSIDLSKCKKNDILISSLGATLKYVRPTNESEYLDHVVEYVDLYPGTYGTRTNDGYVMKHNRKSELDHDIVEIKKS